MAGVQGNELVALCQKVAGMAEDGEYSDGWCAFCTDRHTAEFFPFCTFCAEYPAQVEGARVPFIKLYRAVTGKVSRF